MLDQLLNTFLLERKPLNVLHTLKKQVMSQSPKPTLNKSEHFSEDNFDDKKDDLTVRDDWLSESDDQFHDVHSHLNFSPNVKTEKCTDIQDECEYYCLESKSFQGVENDQPAKRLIKQCSKSADPAMIWPNQDLPIRSNKNKGRKCNELLLNEYLDRFQKEDAYIIYEVHYNPHSSYRENPEFKTELIPPKTEKSGDRQNFIEQEQS
ncbi:hypothetical protein Ahia01_000150100 [Argonauta hians]